VDTVEKNGRHKRITIRPAEFLVARDRPRRADADAPERSDGEVDKAESKAAKEIRRKIAGIILAIVLALALQTTIARFVVGTVAVDRARA
jgi:hypothetical protein